MTAPTPDLTAIDTMLFGPGGPFEIVPEEVLGEELSVFKERKRSLRELLAASAAFGDQEYIVHGDRRIGYAEHLRLVASTARALQERYGIGPGDRVALFSENRPEWIILFWASVSLGAIATALNGWWTRDEAIYAIEQTRPSVIFGDRKRLARLEGQPLPCPVVDLESEGEALLDHAPEAELPDTPIAEDAPAVILFTSGTTGRPKGAVNTHRGIVGFFQATAANGARGVILAAQLGHPPEENAPALASLMTVPLFHVSGLYAGAVMMLGVGGKSVWRSGRFDPEQVLQLLEQERITSWSPIGSMAPRVLNHPRVEDFDLSNLRNLGQGGGPTSPEILERMKQVAGGDTRARGLGYGLSESCCSLTLITGLELEERPTSVGRPAPTTEIQIRGPEGESLPEGEEGEVFGRSPYLMLEYWRNPEATAETIQPGRWLATGDIGRIEDGYLYINSRARDMILRSGENIYPVEIEHRLEAHPDVAEAAVVGVDHPELGQEVKAIVVPATGCRIDTEALDAFCRETLAAYKVPAHWEIRTEPLPRNAAGKILKNVLEGESESRFVED
ncbi:MAG: acyl--CoA ligase [Deltaproteobacteria bacterium]|jgi:acyl-CoA synthetase (AMP-forming)/AMP-acid ligase II|nr:acyl--CoA ligase [Deltaproteobacteria bacterium]